MIFGFDVVVELDDVGMIEFCQDASLVNNFFFPGFLDSLDSNEIEFPFLPGFEDDGVFSFCFLLIEMIVIHNLNSNYNLAIIIIPFYSFFPSILSSFLSSLSRFFIILPPLCVIPIFDSCIGCYFVLWWLEVDELLRGY